MATDDCQISGSSAEPENAEQAILSALKGAESDNDLRRGSLPVRMLTQSQFDTTDTRRSFSANGKCSRDTPLTLNLHRETKAAFEHLPFLPAKIVEDVEKSEEESAEPPSSSSVNDYSTKVRQTVQNVTDKPSTSKEQMLFAAPIQDKLFQTRTAGSEKNHHAFRGQLGQSLSSEVPSRQLAEITKNSKVVNTSCQPATEADSKNRHAIKKQEEEGRQDEDNDTPSTETQQTADGRTEKEATDITYEPEDDSRITDSRERSDTIESLLSFPVLQSETTRRRRSSTASLQPFSVPTHSDQPGASRTRQFSLGNPTPLPTPSTSGQSGAPPTPGSSDIPKTGRRRSSQTRRTSIAAASVFGSRRESVQGEGQKKGSIGLGTLASSLVKWKINTLRAAKKAKETIAKDAKHQEFMDRTADRIKTELPRSLLVSIQEEAYPIILRTTQAYRSQLGAKHKLTVQASERLADLMRDLKSPY